MASPHDGHKPARLYRSQSSSMICVNQASDQGPSALFNTWLQPLSLERRIPQSKRGAGLLLRRDQAPQGGLDQRLEGGALTIRKGFYVVEKRVGNIYGRLH